MWKRKKDHKIFTAKREKSIINIKQDNQIKSYSQFILVTLIIGFFGTIFYVTNLLDTLMWGIPLLLKVGITLEGESGS